MNLGENTMEKNIDTFTEKDLAIELNIAFRTLQQAHKTKLKRWVYTREKLCKGTYIYHIENFYEKSNFMKTIESIAEVEVQFPNEKTAEQLLYLFIKEDLSTSSDEEIAEKMQLSSKTIGKYINLFREVGILKFKLPYERSREIDLETGEIIMGKRIDLNDSKDYKYYLYGRNKEKTEIPYSQYRFVLAQYYKGRQSKYYLFLSKGLPKQLAAQKASTDAYNEIYVQYEGFPVRMFSKSLTEKAHEKLIEHFE